MSLTQTATGASVLVALGSALLRVVLPDVPPIVVHSLEYQDGVILQDRTVTADGPVFYATWKAQILDTATGKPVDICTGTGSWNYTVGRRTYPLSLEEWTGRPECTAGTLRPGTYQPVASWFWGDDQTSHAGAPFTITPPDPA